MEGYMEHHNGSKAGLTLTYDHMECIQVISIILPRSVHLFKTTP